MKSLLLRIRYFLIPPGTRREGWYYVFRYLLLQRRFGWRHLLRKIRLVSGLRVAQLFSGQHISPEDFQYQLWMKEHDPSRRQLSCQRKEVMSWSSQPVFCLVIPLDPAEMQFLDQTLESILAQTYPYWKALLIASSQVSFPSSLAALLDTDVRFQLIQAPVDLKGIVKPDDLPGDFVMILRSGDTLSPQALYETASQLHQNPDLDILYFDQDQYDPQTQRRSSPWFKPSGWSPDLLLSVNYLSHAVIRTSRIAALQAPFPPQTDLQEWDLMLRLTETSVQFQHIPQVLVHDAHPRLQTVGWQDASPTDWEWMRAAIESHLARLGTSAARVTIGMPGVVRVSYPIDNTLVSIIIPNRNHLRFIESCISSIMEKSTYPNYEILLVDNQSDEAEVQAYYDLLAEDNRIRLLSYPHPFNFHAINNWAASKAQGDVLVFLNNDTEVITADWLEELAGCALRPDVGVVGAKLLRPNGKIQHVGMILGLMGHASDICEDAEDHAHTIFGSVDWYRDYHAVTGACMATRKEVFDRLGGFDETYVVGYGDIDLCLRAKRLGYRVVYTPFAVLTHHEGGTRKLWLPRSDVLRATMKMWSAVEAGDSYFNPNLSYHSRLPVFSLPQEEGRRERLLRILQEFGLVEGGASLDPSPVSMPYEQKLPPDPDLA